MAGELDDLRASLADRETQGPQQFKDIIEADKTRADIKNRDTIVQIVIAVYFVSILTILFHEVLTGVRDNENSFQNMAEVLKIGVIPIVTLVIGHYFGSKQN
jgi:hypothetical protein